MSQEQVADVHQVSEQLQSLLVSSSTCLRFFSSCLHVFSSPAIAAGETKEEVCEDFFVLEVQELERAVLDFLYPWTEIESESSSGGVWKGALGDKLFPPHGKMGRLFRVLQDESSGCYRLFDC